MFKNLVRLVAQNWIQEDLAEWAGASFGLPTHTRFYGWKLPWIYRYQMKIVMFFLAFQKFLNEHNDQDVTLHDNINAELQ